MRLLPILTALTIIFLPGIAQAEELSDSPQFRYRSVRLRGISRPSHRSVERATHTFRDDLAVQRRNFQGKLQTIESIRDTMRDEFVHQPDEGQEVFNQDFTPYHWNIRRRHVRHQYWDSYFQRGTKAHVGQGILGQKDLLKAENYRNDIEVDAGGR
ncbi:hypothetical protein COU75_03775 [Candidatus Peregrinibacteria bacterium CG10_big_fil_rev_8_21_14_0_10_42_8]|nr:MAG: hypothetical protein COU75_03775 [Candidatus Peregrinibacteria bacterium CG10_big_fil_rev_8_21_14_0_10_42_8]